MKATGIVRRIDDLGRVVIPKEIRRTMHIREGDPLEIFTNTEGEVIFKKYSSIGELTELATQYCDVLYHTANVPAAICDRDRVIAVGGLPKRDLLETRLSAELESIMEKRQPYRKKRDDVNVMLCAGCERVVTVAVPIITAGDITGCVVLFGEEGSSASEIDTQVKLAQAASQFLSKQTGE